MRRALIVAATGLAVLAGLVVLGRWERAHYVHEELARLNHVQALVGPRLESRALAAYRLSESVDCLLYRVGSNPYALELCFDAEGRLIDAFDRRHGTSIGSLHTDPGAATTRVAPARLLAIMRRLASPDHLPASPRGTLPIGIVDGGPVSSHAGK